MAVTRLYRLLVHHPREAFIKAFIEVNMALKGLSAISMNRCSGGFAASPSGYSRSCFTSATDASHRHDCGHRRAIGHLCVRVQHVPQRDDKSRERSGIELPALQVADEARNVAHRTG